MSLYEYLLLSHTSKNIEKDTIIVDYKSVIFYTGVWIKTTMLCQVYTCNNEAFLTVWLCWMTVSCNLYWKMGKQIFSTKVWNNNTEWKMASVQLYCLTKKHYTLLHHTLQECFSWHYFLKDHMWPTMTKGVFWRSIQGNVIKSVHRQKFY